MDKRRLFVDISWFSGPVGPENSENVQKGAFLSISEAVAEDSFAGRAIAGKPGFVPNPRLSEGGGSCTARHCTTRPDAPRPRDESHPFVDPGWLCQYSLTPLAHVHLPKGAFPFCGDKPADLSVYSRKMQLQRSTSDAVPVQSAAFWPPPR